VIQTAQSADSVPVEGRHILALVCRVAAWALLVSVFCLAVYRAATQSIAHDESLTYTWFLDGGVYDVLKFNSTNHVLLTLLAKICVKTLGVSELSLRLPALMGAALYLIGIYLLSRELLGEGILMLLSVALLSLHPTMMDFMAAARGYSLGSAFLIGAMYLLARLVGERPVDPGNKTWRRDCMLMSVLLGLSVTANLTNLIPAVSLGVLFLFMASRYYLSADLRFGNLVWDSVAPGAALGLFILWPFLIQARPAQFAMGLPAVGDSLRDIFNSSFLYKWTGDVYSTSLGAVPPAPGTWEKIISDFGVHYVLPFLFVFVVIGLILVWRKKTSPRGSEIACFLFAGAAILSVILNWVLHVTIRMNYPVSRTALYFVPLFTVAATLVAREISALVPGTWLKIPGVLIAAVIIADYVASLNTKYFRYNQYDVISRELFQSISSDVRARGLTNVRVGGTWWYQPEIDFYRERYHAKWIMPYDIVDHSYWWNTPNALSPAEYDYFVFTPANDPALAGPRFRVIFRNQMTGITVEAHDK
jgi:hypothetical protein